MDFVYFIFFMIHLPATLLVDLQAIYPTSLTPSLIAKIPEFYVGMSRDPLIGGAMGYFGEPANYVWFKSFLLLEAIFQVPVFILGMRGLLKDSKKIYTLLLIYAASTATTTLACLAVLLATPLTADASLAPKTVSITPEQRLLLLSSYIPFFIIPLVMTIDMARRISGLISAGIHAQDLKKSH
ncbi:hypothetical protein NM688_g5883 [Phlebia brevispora]|uniref:Uncharacterized protein n=1 Tax=Phlebia brevispora TaxID=194682 RepID=A0ACC1SNF9_9APHY|nr:hypothetical protein NM688_g5883 [Phlebia brevispora]